MTLLGHLDQAGLIPEQALGALLVGSQARGWQHARSDLDVVVVSPNTWTATVQSQQPVALTQSSIGVAVTAVDGVLCEVKYWTEAQILEMLDKVSWAAWDAGNAGAALSTNEAYLIERLPHAVALVGAEWANDITDRLRDSAALSSFALACLTRADYSLDDVSGLWQSGDVRSALLAAQRAFVHVTDALTASLGSPGTDSKWRLRRVESVNSDTLTADEFWRLTTMQDFDAQQPESWLNLLVYRCSQIMLDVRLGR
ncbi:hypothetical protein [Catellatospora tritici]|uniref:hypothetical protein n=1 Tax=Catellatospora tritici TaxID=2851566 RepID=UPI001C2DB739|nr:hypothetical protein [Catellatospora tritici]MBV1849990.1 hypothetical protein [Catellatospora tritici]